MPIGRIRTRAYQLGNDNRHCVMWKITGIQRYKGRDGDGIKHMRCTIPTNGCIGKWMNNDQQGTWDTVLCICGILFVAEESMREKSYIESSKKHRKDETDWRTAYYSVTCFVVPSPPVSDPARGINSRFKMIKGHTAQKI